MRIKMTKGAWLIVVILVFAIFIRSINLAELRPIERDEISWLMVGISLFENGIPETWTIHLFNDAYRSVGVSVGATVKPYLDHPPLFSIFIGGWAYLIGERSVDDLNWALARIPMIIIATISILFTYLFAKEAYGKQLALFTLFAFVFFPSHIIASRIISPEHLIGLMLMFSLWLYVLISKKTDQSTRVLNILLLIVCFVSPLLKLTGMVVPGSIVFIALLERKFRVATRYITVAMMSLISFAVWGYFHNWELFYKLAIAHQERGQSFEQFWRILTKLDIGNFGFYDPSIIVGFIGILILAVEGEFKKKNYLVGAPLLIFSFLFMYVAPWESYGWYRYPLYPLFALGLGYIYYKLYQGRFIYYVLFIPLVAVIFQHTKILDHQSLRRMVLVLLYIWFMVPVIFNRRDKVVKSAFIAILVVLFGLQLIWSINTLP